jgi:uncharacterized membrane protein
MDRGRLEAFSDGVIAILITIMVLELKVPHEPTFAALHDVAPTLCSYVLSFVFLGIYWNSHHHMLHVTKRVNGRILWANLHLLFWLSLVPFVTAWMGETEVAPVPTAMYGVVLLLAAIAYTILQATIVADQGPHSIIKRAVGDDLKSKVSLACYTAAIPLAFVNSWVSCALYVFVAAIWLVPDKRIEAVLAEEQGTVHLGKHD